MIKRRLRAPFLFVRTALPIWTDGVYAKSGDNGCTRFQHFCEGCGSPLFASGECGSDNWGIGLEFYPPARPAQAGAATLAPLRRAMDQRYQGFAGTAGRLIPEVSNPCIKGGRRAKQAAQGRLAQLVRASRLHREGRRFESVAAYQPSLRATAGQASGA